MRELVDDDYGVDVVCVDAAGVVVAVVRSVRSFVRLLVRSARKPPTTPSSWAAAAAYFQLCQRWRFTQPFSVDYGCHESTPIHSIFTIQRNQRKLLYAVHALFSRTHTHTYFVIVHFIHRPWNLMQNLCFYESIERERGRIKWQKHERVAKRSENMERNENFLCVQSESWKKSMFFFRATHSSLSITVVCKLKILYWVVNTSSLHQITLMVILCTSLIS